MAITPLESTPMSMACIAAGYINAFARAKFPEYGDARMASIIANGDYIDAFDHVGYGTHKYIPADRWTQDLGERIGAGVFAYWKMRDESYLLLTCHGNLAFADTHASPAEWGEFAK